MLGDLPIPFHQFTESLEDCTLYIQITCLKDSFWIWAMGSNGQTESPSPIGPFAMAMPTPFEKSSLGSTLLKPSLDSTSEQMAKRLSTKLKCQIMTSINQIPNDKLAIAEKLILKHLECLKHCDTVIQHA